MIRFASLGSGSRGNATLIDIGEQLILVDCGFSLKQAEARFARLAVRPGDVTAVLITHEHADHVSGVAALSHKYGIPIFASYGTFKALDNQVFGGRIYGGIAFPLGDVIVHPVVVPHDAREPIQFVFEYKSVRIGVISDLGQVTPHVISQYMGCSGLMMESNHDEDLLLKGNYPAKLKKRIAGNLGHLSNDQAVFFLDMVKHSDMKVVVGHVSEQNNRIDLLEASFEQFRSYVDCLHFATQETGVDWVSIDK